MSHSYKRLYIAAAAFIGISSSAYAQSFSHCESVYQSATRNISFTETSYSSLNTIYDQYCSSTGERKSGTTGVGVEAVVKSIPISFTGSHASDEEKLTSFCKTYNSVRYTTTASSAYQDSVVNEALKSFNQCIDISRKNIVIEVSQPTGTTAAFSFRFGSDVNYELQGVLLGGNITCSSAFDSNDVRNVDETTHQKVSKNFSINCKRQPIDRSGGGKYYPKTSVILSSNVGPYTAVFPADEVLDIEYASALAARMATIEGRSTGISQKLDELTLTTNNDRASAAGGISSLRNGLKLHSYYVGRGEHHHLLDKGAMPIGCHNIDDWAAATCGSLQRHVNKGPDRGGNRCGYQHAIITCYGF